MGWEGGCCRGVRPSCFVLWGGKAAYCNGLSTYTHPPTHPHPKTHTHLLHFVLAQVRSQVFSATHHHHHHHTQPTPRRLPPTQLHPPPNAHNHTHLLHIVLVQVQVVGVLRHLPRALDLAVQRHQLLHAARQQRRAAVAEAADGQRAGGGGLLLAQACTGVVRNEGLACFTLWTEAERGRARLYKGVAGAGLTRLPAQRAVDATLSSITAATNALVRSMRLCKPPLAPTFTGRCLACPFVSKRPPLRATNHHARSQRCGRHGRPPP